MFGTILKLISLDILKEPVGILIGLIMNTEQIIIPQFRTG